MGGLLILRSFLHSPLGSRGAKLYLQHCQNCHMEEGQGLGQLIPPLAGSDYLERHPENIPCIIRYGQEGEVQVNGILYNHPMPANPSLSQEDMYQLIRYIYTAWGNEGKEFTRSEIEELLDSCSKP